ncbi:hypothetical protein AVEN_141888-1 [Araneus ventricosus]|uniref:HAT C-terminal dimerisation domain-containing protein n=1 Tax=Araneus ventricosus TaxID=182803 RepID=A0A4Y2PJU0_ARAVE|nr:hypothetical protein AVEN_141888-1 [Araneus ventricosus]
MIIESELRYLSSKHNAAKILSQKLLGSLKERSVKILQNSLLCHDSLSDPRFKKLYMNPPHCQQSLYQFQSRSKLSPLPQTEARTTPKPLWPSHDERVAKSGPVEIEGSFLNELRLYLRQPLLPRWSDPLVFWDQNKICIPGLSFIAKNYLSSVGS